MCTYCGWAKMLDQHLGFNHGHTNILQILWKCVSFIFVLSKLCIQSEDIFFQWHSIFATWLQLVKPTMMRRLSSESGSPTLLWTKWVGEPDYVSPRCHVHQALHVPRFENQAASTSHQTWPDNKIKPTVIWYSLQLRLVIKAHHHHDQRKHSFIIPAAFCAALYLQWCIVSLLQRGHYTWTPETKQPLLSQLLHNPVKPNQTTFLSTYSITWLVIFCSSFIFNMIITLW